MAHWGRFGCEHGDRTLTLPHEAFAPMPGVFEGWVDAFAGPSHGAKIPVPNIDSGVFLAQAPGNARKI